MEGRIDFISPRGFFFIAAKDPHGWLIRFFGLMNRVVRAETEPEVGCHVIFEISAEKPRTPNGCAVAERIEILAKPSATAVSK